MQAQTKGANLVNTITVVRERLGEQEFNALVEELPPNTRTLLKRRIFAVEWIPLSDWMPFLEAIFVKKCASNELVWRQWARAFCERDFNSVYKMFLKLGSPDFLLDRTARVWSTYNNTGKLEIVEKGTTGNDKRITLRLMDFEPYPLYAVSIHGFIEQLLAMSGAKTTSVVMSKREVSNDRMMVEYTVVYR